MGVVHGGTIEDLARSDILISLVFEPKGTKKSIDDIARARGIDDGTMVAAMRAEADRMAKNRYSISDQNGTFIFTKDDQGNYYLENARKYG